MLRRVPRALRALSVVALFLLPAGVTEAQVPDEGPSSLGFANPDSTKPVRAYRLPTWHWSTWILRADGRATRRSRSSDGSQPRDTVGRANREFDGFAADLSVAPTYRSFWESEERRAFLRLSPRLSLQRNGRTVSDAQGERERDLLNFNARIALEGTLREYMTDRVFFFGDVDGSLSFSRDTESGGESGEKTRTAYDADATVRLGIGAGRVRVVTPVIRALRVRERLRTVAPSASVSDEQVQAAARQLARRPGYQAVYDRPDKYFWRDFFGRIGAADRSPFETFYVADVLREPVGVRREGAEIVVGPSGFYDGRLRRIDEESQPLQRESAERGHVGGFARGQWYRNVTLRHQLGADAEATYRNFVGPQGPVNHEVGFEAEGQWLWVLADRLRLDTRLRANLRYLRDPRAQGAFRPQTRYVLSSNVLVFVENSLSLTAGANVRYRYDGDVPEGSTSEFRAGLQFRINYVLSRALE